MSEVTSASTSAEGGNKIAAFVRREIGRVTALASLLDEVQELSFGRPLSENGNTVINAALSPDNRLIALLKDEGGKAKPIAVFAAAN
jgi:tRNA pseudouridine55 synthase